MNILLYSKAFHPMVGGIETVTAMMAEWFNKLGHRCEVLTPVENPEADTFPYAVHRQPGFRQTLKLVAAADIVISKGASLALLPYCLLVGKPFIWVHSGYQASCVDGLGWVDGEAAPMTPRASLAFHYRRSGLLFALKAAGKLYLRRLACHRLVAVNIAVSDWVAMRQPFANQVRIHNPFPLHRFAVVATADAAASPRYAFLYLGRLVSEKGVGTLIRALALLAREQPQEDLTLLLVGDGAWRANLEALARELKVDGQIEFAGRLTGEPLLEAVRQGGIAVVPSEWEEPMGGVALELLAAGKPLIVAKNGGLAECVGDAALLFDNGDHEMLARCLWRLYTDAALRATLVANAARQIKQFEPETLAREYLALFARVLGTKQKGSQETGDSLVSENP